MLNFHRWGHLEHWPMARHNIICKANDFSSVFSLFFDVDGEFREFHFVSFV